MGDMADDFRAMKDQKRTEKSKLEPQRIKYALKILTKSGIDVHESYDDPTKLIVDGYISFWPYTGWWSGKGFGSGRGIHKLIEKVSQDKELKNDQL